MNESTRVLVAGVSVGRRVVRERRAPAASFDDARRVTVPVHELLQWDDEGNDRRMALAERPTASAGPQLRATYSRASLSAPSAGT